MKTRTLLVGLVAIAGCGGMAPVGPIGTQAAVRSQDDLGPVASAYTGSTDIVPRGDVKIFDSMGTPSGSIDFDGEFRDADKTPLGHIAADGTVRSASQKVLGTVRSDGTVLDAKLDPIGHVMDDGAIDTASFSKVGEIDEDGTLRDVASVSVGRIEGYKPDYRDEVAAYVFFFAKGTMKIVR